MSLQSSASDTVIQITLQHRDFWACRTGNKSLRGSGSKENSARICTTRTPGPSALADPFSGPERLTVSVSAGIGRSADAALTSSQAAHGRGIDAEALGTRTSEPHRTCGVIIRQGRHQLGLRQVIEIAYKTRRFSTIRR